MEFILPECQADSCEIKFLSVDKPYAPQIDFQIFPTVYTSGMCCQEIVMFLAKFLAGFTVFIKKQSIPALLETLRNQREPVRKKADVHSAYFYTEKIIYSSRKYTFSQTFTFPQKQLISVGYKIYFYK